MEPDWDLHAVVRGFAAINKSETDVASAITVDVDHSRSGTEASYNMIVRQTEGEKHHDFCSTYLPDADELHELSTSRSLLELRQTQSVQPTISSYLAALQAYNKRTQQQQQYKGSHLFGTTSASIAAPTTQTTPKPKRRYANYDRCQLTFTG